MYALQGEQQAWHVDASAGAVLGNAAINDDFYGVRPAFATGQRPAYAAKSGLMLTCLGLGCSYRLQPDWRAFAFLRYDNYTGAANRASPPPAAPEQRHLGRHRYDVDAATLGQPARHAGYPGNKKPC